MVFDFKKEYKEFYNPKTKPQIIEIPEMNFLAVRGKGNPNVENGEYLKSIEKLYSVAYTIKMSKKTDYKIDGYFDFVVPPLEGFWWQEGIKGVDYSDKDSFSFISIIRLPDFVKKSDFEWAIKTAEEKKKVDLSVVEYFTYNEGLCVQCMHIGPYDNEPETVAAMHEHIENEGYVIDISDERMHHEIYIGDPRKSDPEKLKTIIRHPIKKK